MSRNSLSALALVVSSVVFSLLLAESLLRVLPDPEAAAGRYREVMGGPLHEADPLLGWRTVPNTQATLQGMEYKISVHNNSRGIRGPEYPYTPERRESRILVIGDSFTAGYTVQFEETFGQVAERSLNANASQPYTVIAAGTEAYSTDQELLFFVEEGAKYQPEITVLMFYFNDVWFNTQTTFWDEGFGSKPLFKLEGQKLVLASKPNATPKSAASPPSATPPPQVTEDVSPTLAIKRWLNEHSHLYRLVRRALKSEPGQATIPLRDVWFQYPLPSQYGVFRTTYDDDTRRAWTITEALILQLADEAARRGSRFLLFHVPPRESVYDDVWNKAIAYHALKDTEWRSDQVEVELRRICAKNKLDCILPTAHFREQASKIGPRRLYLVNDPHWNREGHELVGKLLADHVQRR